MLINTDVTIAYKCPHCGTFEFFNISLFRMSYEKGDRLSCRCGKSSIIISHKGSRIYEVQAPCMACGDEHVFTLNAKSLCSQGIHTLCCPNSGMQQCFIGTDSDVRSKIDMVEGEQDELMNLFGYDNYFKNTRVMFDTVNKIHDIAEKGNLSCECGCSDVELILLTDSIYLKCKKCPGARIIYASSNEDLKHTLSKDQILLLDDASGYALNRTDRLLRKTDG